MFTTCTKLAADLLRSGQTKVGEKVAVAILRYQNIVRLDIRMHYIRFLQQTQSQEELVSIRSDCTNVQTDVLSETLDDFTQVHTGKGKSALVL